MAETVQFTIGAEASCSDGACGEVTRVIVDPVAESVTHLVVEPEHRRGLGRLVPLGLIDATSGEVRLSCTQAEFGKLEPAEGTRFIPGSSGNAGYGPGQGLRRRTNATGRVPGARRACLRLAHAWARCRFRSVWYRRVNWAWTSCASALL